MARKNYTDEFRQRAVDLYESTPGSTLKGIAGDLGISRGALKEWVDKFGSGVTVAAASPPGGDGATGVAGGEGPPVGGRPRGLAGRGPQARDGAGHGGFNRSTQWVL